MRRFFGLSETSTVMLTAVGAVCFIFLIAGLCIINWVYPFEKPLPFIAGLTAGCLQSMLKVAMLEKSISRTLDMGKEQAVALGALQAIGRYVISMAVLAGALIFPALFGLFGVVSGILSLQFAAYITSFVLKKAEKSGDYTDPL